MADPADQQDAKPTGSIVEPLEKAVNELLRYARELEAERHVLLVEIKRCGELLTHAWNDGEIQICEACHRWFRLEETHSMDEGGWICRGCAALKAHSPAAEPTL